jgi:hypothetical protein
MTISTFLVERNVINEKPPYQRQGAIWSLEKRQLFIDSVFNHYDVPKIYLHDLRGHDPIYKYAIVDGKQRLDAIWGFLTSTFPLADDFKAIDTQGRPPLLGGSYFKDLHPDWQDLFKGRALDVVLVQNAEEEDIEELFSRLNNGEPLNAAEKRNAMGGRMCTLIREVAEKPFFEYLPYGNNRYQHLELAAKLLLLEQTEAAGGPALADLKKKFLDKLVADNKSLPDASAQGLSKRLDSQLGLMTRIFDKKDPLLAKQAYPPLYYIWTKLMNKEYAHKSLYSWLHKFLEDFQAERTANLEKPEDDRDPALLEFDRLMQQGTNDIGSLETRVSILRRYFLQSYPEVSIRDRNRAFSDEERFAIWILGGKQCAECKKELDLADMHADHELQWAFGGETTLKNARSLCASCNLKLAQQVGKA